LAKTVLALDEKNVPAMVVAALAYFRKGQISLCRAVLRFIADIDPNNATGFYLAGHLALHDNEHTRSRLFFEKAVEKNPNLPDAWAMLCVWYVQGKNWRETRGARAGKDALKACTKACALDSRNYKSRLNLGTVYRGLASDCRTTAAARCDIQRQSCRAAGTGESNCQARFTSCLKPAVTRCKQGEAGYYKKAKDTYWKANALYGRYLRRKGRPARLYPMAVFNIGVLYLDAAAFPGESAISRLQKAKKYLRQYLRAVDPRQARKESAAVKKLIQRADTKIQAVKAKAAAAAAAAAARRAAARARGGG
jgi:tetratricopeptide (TPR) repeat protein